MNRITEAIDNLSFRLSQPSVSDWMMIGITFVYVVATIFICIFNNRSAKAAREQIIESQKQQNQNVGIQLYSIRKNFLKLFSEEKFDDIFWDTPILFSETTSELIRNTILEYGVYEKAQSDFDLYLERMHQDCSELYDKYMQMCASNMDDEEKNKAIAELCKDYSPIIQGENNTLRVLDYHTVDNALEKTLHKYNAIRTKAFFCIQEEIKKSIQYRDNDDNSEKD